MGIWSEIKYALNSTLGTADFAPIDELITGGCQTFTESGMFVVPKGVKYIFVTACAGGGGGGWTARYAASGGAGGACVFRKRFDVSGMRTINITVGQGGKGGVRENSRGSNGGATVVGDLLTLPGGDGGYYSTSSGVSATSATSGNEWAGRSGQDGVISFELGFYGKGNGERIDGGGAFGRGGVGQAGTEPVEGDANGELGGGGGGANTWNLSTHRPGDGGDGIVIIEWGASAL